MRRHGTRKNFPPVASQPTRRSGSPPYRCVPVALGSKREERGVPRSAREERGTHVSSPILILHNSENLKMDPRNHLFSR
jgi:hypothetical protein